MTQPFLYLRKGCGLTSVDTHNSKDDTITVNDTLKNKTIANTTTSTTKSISGIVLTALGIVHT